MKYFSMFSGIGGFELGISNKGECIGYSEIDKYAIQIYQKHFTPHKKCRLQCHADDGHTGTSILWIIWVSCI